ncbi:Rrf2 family transcriptional regulator [bacterium]|nr:MAG: Rrf2 family transcriptional regulator [bacterium]
MNFSKPVTYAIRSLIHLAREGNKGPVLSSTIAQEESLPAPYLIKVLGVLTTHGMVKASRGRGGGFTLAKNPTEINLYDIFILFEGLALTQDCLLGLGKCGEVKHCPIHDKWEEPKGHMEAFLKNTTIEELARMRDSLE